TPSLAAAPRPPTDAGFVAVPRPGPAAVPAAVSRARLTAHPRRRRPRGRRAPRQRLRRTGPAGPASARGRTVRGVHAGAGVLLDRLRRMASPGTREPDVLRERGRGGGRGVRALAHGRVRAAAGGRRGTRRGRPRRRY